MSCAFFFRNTAPRFSRQYLRIRLAFGDRPARFVGVPDHSSLAAGPARLPRVPATLPRHHATLSSIPNTAAEPQLRRELGFRDLVLFNIAAVIGIRWLAAAAHTGPVSITLWLLAAAFFFIPSAPAVATLSAKFSEEGGIYVWTKQGLRRLARLPMRLVLLAQQSVLSPQPAAGRHMAGYALGLSEVKIHIVSGSLPIL